MSDQGKDAPATQRDLELWGGQLQQQITATKEDLEKEIVDTKDELKQEIAEIRKDVKDEIQAVISHMDAKIEGYVENRAEELLGVKHDEIKLIQEKQADQGTRIESLEQRVGV